MSKMYKSFFMLLQCVILSFIAKQASGAAMPNLPNTNGIANKGDISVSYQVSGKTYSKNPKPEIIQLLTICTRVAPESETLNITINNFLSLRQEERCVVVYTDEECRQNPVIITEEIKLHNSSISSLRMCSTHLLLLLRDLSRSTERFGSYQEQIERLESNVSCEVYSKCYSNMTDNICTSKPSSIPTIASTTTSPYSISPLDIQTL